ncbi:Protein affecting phage T7 exclusion by the F plasmid [gamma proteobacterium IMCC1989]|nr:Protein affecting phage T7 exclusion by the F plasmid [gamma proteobacterium IMCC1989]
MRILLLLFIVVPIVEMWLLITVGQQIGALPTIGLVLLTAFIGVSLLRYQGAAALLKARTKMSSGELPAREIADGLFFAVGGALLLTPGFVTDVIGFACLTPGIRTVLIGSFAKNIFASKFSASQFGQGQAQYSQTSHQSEHMEFTQQSKTSSDHATIIDGDFERHKE